PASPRRTGSGSSIRSSPRRTPGRAPGWGSPSWPERCTRAAGWCGWTGRGREERCSRSSYHKRVVPMRLLIVDDHAGLRQSLALLLQESGDEVAAEGDPEQALRRATSEAFDAILCDVRMPKMDGLTFLR